MGNWDFAVPKRRAILCLQTLVVAAVQQSLWIPCAKSLSHCCNVKYLNSLFMRRVAENMLGEKKKEMRLSSHCSWVLVVVRGDKGMLFQKCAF